MSDNWRNVPLVSKSQFDDFASAMATKNTLEVVDQRHKNGGSAERSRTSAFIHTSGLTAPVYDTGGNLFGAGNAHKSGYGLVIPQNLQDQTLIEYVVDQSSTVYGQIEKHEGSKVIVKQLTKGEFEAKKTKKGLSVATFGSSDVEKVHFGLAEKIILSISDFFFTSRDDDSAASLIIMIVKLLFVAGLVVGLIGAVSYFVF